MKDYHNLIVYCSFTICKNKECSHNQVNIDYSKTNNPIARADFNQYNQCKEKK